LGKVLKLCIWRETFIGHSQVLRELFLCFSV
jgi:hypothetical protein